MAFAGVKEIKGLEVAPHRRCDVKGGISTLLFDIRIILIPSRHLEKLKELFYSSIQYKSMMHLKQDELVTSFRYYNELEKEKMEILADKERQVENLLKRVNRKTIKRVIKSKNKEIEKGLPAILQLLN